MTEKFKLSEIEENKETKTIKFSASKESKKFGGIKEVSKFKILLEEIAIVTFPVLLLPLILGFSTAFFSLIVHRTINIQTIIQNIFVYYSFYLGILLLFIGLFWASKGVSPYPQKVTDLIEEYLKTELLVMGFIFLGSAGFYFHMSLYFSIIMLFIGFYLEAKTATSQAERMKVWNQEIED